MRVLVGRGALGMTGGSATSVMVVVGRGVEELRVEIMDCGTLSLNKKDHRPLPFSL